MKRIESGFEFEIVYYISGPMAGYPENNFPAFEFAETSLIEAGISVSSPHKVIHHGLSGKPEEWSEYLRGDLVEMLSECRGIILLNGWAQSKGAALELQVALALGWPVWFFDAKTLTLTNMNRREVAA